MKHHNQQKGIIVKQDGDKPRVVLRCHQCGSYLGEANQHGELAGVIYCKCCKHRTEVIRSTR